MNFKLDSDTHDLVYSSGNFQMVRNLDERIQKVKQRYLEFFGEWFLDNTRGVPYFQFIFVKNSNIDLVNSTLMDVALSVPGILQLNSFALDYDDLSRQLTATLDATSTDGDITGLNIPVGV